MHAQEKSEDSARTAAGRRARPVRPAGPLDHLAGAGNAAVVQTLRAAGHPWAVQRAEEDEHRHGPGCAHPQAVRRSAVHDVLRAAGRPLESGVRADMEARLGADFSDVRLHSDAAARASAAEVGARAYTSGSHVVLGDGGGDRHTLAHELTHVIQQRTGPVAGTDNGAGLKVSDPSDRFEREAEANAVRALAGSGGHAGAGERADGAGHAGAGERADVQRAEERPVAGGAPVVQRAYDPDDPDNVQNQLHLKHWQGKAEPGLVAGAQRVEDGVTYKNEDILDRIGKKLLEELDGKDPAAPRLKLYRSVTPAEAAQLRGHWGAGQHAKDESYIRRGPAGRAAEEKPQHHKGPTIGNHLGDIEQAEDYYQAKKGNDIMLCFTLKPGAHELLFKDDYLAVAPNKKLDVFQGVPELGGKHRPASEHEGTREGFIGLKAEEREQRAVAGAKARAPRKKQSATYEPQGGDFSVSLAGRAKQTSPSRLLFQLFVADVTVEKSKDPRQFPVGMSFLEPLPGRG
ncbi:eCIS core domain-containing protein [Streptomyces sp. CA-253872]|uniref:eCIS core domain-containing protein n=1 Tax=Streptomyces sp. CA-253872 TaxID=3240067 RepID=UPI003D8E290A